MRSNPPALGRRRADAAAAAATEATAATATGSARAEDTAAELEPREREWLETLEWFTSAQRKASRIRQSVMKGWEDAVICDVVLAFYCKRDEL